MLIDTHCHLTDPPLLPDLDGVLDRAFACSVTAFVVPSVSGNDWPGVRRVDGLRGIRTAYGVHPWKAREGVDEALLEVYLRSNAVAVGEIGLDWKTDVPRSTQLDCLETQLRVARKLGLPVLLHCRGAFEELLEMITSLPPPEAVLHGYSRSPELMRRFLDAGCCIGFGGAVTRKRAVAAGRSAALVPGDRFVLETDAPWIGVEGGASEPGSLPLVARAMAGIRGETPEQVARASTANAARLGLAP